MRRKEGWTDGTTGRRDGETAEHGRNDGAETGVTPIAFALDGVLRIQRLTVAEGIRVCDIVDRGESPRKG